jgi:HEAT repeat protein
MWKKRGGFLTGLLVAMLAASVFLWKPLHLDEPWYRRKSLSGWLAQYGAGPGDYKPSPEIDAALQHIGPRAVPFLLSLLQVKDPSAGMHASGIYPLASTNLPPAVWSPSVASRAATTNISFKARFATWVEAYTPIRFHHAPPPASWDHWKAYLGFQALGPEGGAAIPELLKLAKNASDNSNPSGTGMAPNIGFWKDKASVAMFAAQSATYLSNGQPPFNGSVRRNVILVDGEIAAWSLAAIGADSVPALTDMLADPVPRLRCRAAVALGLIGPGAERAVPALVKMLDDPDMSTRWEATDALGCISRRSELVVPALIQALSDPNVGMKFTAMKSLGEFGEQASNAIPALLAQFPEGDMRIGQYAASALIKISRETTEKKVLPFLLNRIKSSPYPYIRAITLETLGEATYEPQVVVPAAMEAIDDTNVSLRVYGIIVLSEFGPAASAAVPKLTALIHDPDTNTRAQAVAALRKIIPRQ